MAASYAAPMALPVQWLKLEDGLVFEVPGGTVCADVRRAKFCSLKGVFRTKTFEHKTPTTERFAQMCRRNSFDMKGGV